LKRSCNDIASPKTLPVSPLPLPNKGQQFAELPIELTNGRYFVLWRYGRADRHGRRPKPPLQVDGSYASPTNAATWCDFETALSAFSSDASHTFEGIGRVIVNGGPYVGVDIDRCRDSTTGMIEPWAQNIIDELDTYTEVSPSQTGVKCWLRGHLVGLVGRSKDYQNGKVEVFDQDRYFTLTGEHLAGTPLTVEDRQHQILAIHEGVFGVSRVGIEQASEPIESFDVDLNTALPKAADDLIEQDESIASVWNRSRPGQGQADKTGSGWCNQLKLRLARKGISAPDIAHTLVVYQRRWGDPPRSSSWYRREATEAIAKVQVDNGFPVGLLDLAPATRASLLAMDAAYRHARLLPITRDRQSLEGLLIAMARYSPDGVKTWPSLVRLAKERGFRRPEHVSRLRSKLVAYGCLKLDRKATRGRNARYILNIFDEEHHRLHQRATDGNPTVAPESNPLKLNACTPVQEKETQWGGDLAA